MSPDKQVDKQKVVYPYSGILLSLKKIHGTQQMNLKDNTKGQILYDSTSMLLLLLLSRFSHVQLCATPQTAAHQAPPSLGFSRQEHWSGLPFPSPVHKSEK